MLAWELLKDLKVFQECLKYSFRRGKCEQTEHLVNGLLPMTMQT